MSRHTVVFLDELAAELTNFKPCPKCSCDLAVCVEMEGEESGEWHVIVPHISTCPELPHVDAPASRLQLIKD